MSAWLTLQYSLQQNIQRDRQGQTEEEIHWKNESWGFAPDRSVTYKLAELYMMQIKSLESEFSRGLCWLSSVAPAGRRWVTETQMQ